jgi:hypothetical protein
LHIVSKPRRPRRAGEWAADNAVTFIVTLAATQSVTLAARGARMSRKSAYALRARDPAFAAAWALALKAVGAHSGEGNKVEEVEDPPVPSGQGDASPSRLGRGREFAGLVAKLRASTPLADVQPAQ